MLDPKKIKKDFPIFQRKINGKPLVYLDNAATSQKPKQVIDAIKYFYENTNGNIHRGIHTLAEESTEQYEHTRLVVAKFINARSPKEIIFTRNTTESINILAWIWAELNIKEGDEIIVSELEHHSNLIPWQERTAYAKAKLQVIPVTKDFTLDLAAYKKLLNKKTKLVAITGMSNVTGYIPPLKEMIKEAHKFGAKILVDGAQSVSHLPADVQDLDCDFLAFSGHKMLGPTGVGVLYVKTEILQDMPALIYGGGMVSEVEQFKAIYKEPPHSFEGGTPNIADTVAFAKALEYLQKIGLKNVHKHEQKLLKEAKKILSKYQEVKMQSPKNIDECGGILSFTIDNIHPHDIAAIFNNEGIAIRAGHHCCQPLMKKLGLTATARLSFYLYNTEEDLEKVEKALQKTLKIFG